MENNKTNNIAETTSIPPVRVLQFLILEKRENLNYELRKYIYREARGIEASTHSIKGWLNSIFFDVQDPFKALNNGEYNKLVTLLESNKYTDLKQAWDLLSNFLYAKGIIVFDTRRKQDTTDLEGENESKNL